MILNRAQATAIYSLHKFLRRLSNDKLILMFQMTPPLQDKVDHYLVEVFDDESW